MVLIFNVTRSFTKLDDFFWTMILRCPLSCKHFNNNLKDIWGNITARFIFEIGTYSRINHNQQESSWWEAENQWNSPTVGCLKN